MLQSFYACYYVAVAISLPFLPPYLRGLGLSGREVSLMLSVAPVLHLGVPLLWGWLADRTQRPDRVLRLACFGAFVFMLPLLVVRTMPAMLFVYAAHQTFAVAITGLADAIALERVRQGADYGRIRVWGSLSFAVTTAVVGPLLVARGERAADVLVPIVLAIAFGISLLAAFGLKGHGERERPHAADVKVLLRDRRFLFLLVFAPLHWACCAPYHGFFAILMKDRAMSATAVGLAFTISVIGEIAALYFFRRLRTRFSLSGLLALTFAVTAVRWWLVSVTQSPAALLALQAVHALTFGVFWGAAIAWVGACVGPRLRATGQTLYTAATFGVGNILGMQASGWLYDSSRGAGTAFAVAGAIELIPLLLMLTYGRRLDPTRTVVAPAGSA